MWTHTDPRRESLLHLLPSSEFVFCFFFPGGLSLDEMSLLMEMGNGITKSIFFFYCIPVKREKVFLLDGTTQALTHGSYGIWQ